MIVGLDNSGKTSILNSLATLNYSGSSAQHNHSSTSSSTFKSSSNTAASEDHGVLDKDNTNKKDNSNRYDCKQPTNSISKSTSSGGGGNIMPTVGYNYERIQYKSLTITVLDFSGQNRYRNLWQEFYNGVDAIVFVVDSSDLIRLVVVRDELETMLSHPYFSTLVVDHQSSSTAPVNLQGSLSPNATLAAQKQITISQGKLIQTPLDQHSAVADSKPARILNSIKQQQQHQQQHLGLKRAPSRRRTKVPILFLANKADLANSVDTQVIIKALNLNQLPAERHPWFIQATSVNLSQGIVEGFDWLVGQLSVS